ncbi:NAD-dependent epimerase/dehydratase family protein [Marinomonas sp. IMCC 4694]|uniref:NAD-dependent epimerase/dehydratase family protein n=1 Tax=Marinomonas sp. IMCC 4694 TaxID=2605432 RepID=UPI0011E86AB0|nr:NAD-dependent epimerase/dehydratase family protein [Marinomonas sp. IMCC 4694]TYL49255.1 NAD-dependent epimerase/dehydratase family protein [Marinomonas sp. IMCC 4694]
MANVLIAGCGDLGSGLATELMAQGHTVTGIRRTQTHFPKGVRGITGDLVTMQDAQLPDVGLIFLIMTPQGRTEASYRAAYLDTAQTLIRRYASSTKKPAVFFVSSTSVYGQSEGEWVDETTAAQPVSATATVLQEAEWALAEAFSSVAVRCSGIYGPGRFRMLEKVLSETPWEANSWTNRVHRDDVVSALVLLANLAFSDQRLPQQVIVTDQTPVSMWELKLWLATCLGAAVITGSGEGFVPTSGKRIQGDYLLSQGWQLRYPSYVAGYRDVIKAFQALPS